MKQPNHAAFDLAQAICVPAARLAHIADVLCQQHQSSPGGLRSVEYTSIVRECVAFLMHYCDFVLYHMGDARRSRAVARLAAVVNQLMNNVDLWKDTKFMPYEDVEPGIRVFRGFDRELVNTRNAEYGRLTKPDGDFSISIDAFADHVVRFVPDHSSKDMRTVAIAQSNRVPRGPRPNAHARSGNCTGKVVFLGSK